MDSVHMQLLLVTIVRTLAEVAGWALLGQGLLGLLAGKGRQGNLVYQVFEIVTSPVIKAVRAITPRFILDTHIPYVAFFLLLWVWIAMGFLKRNLCVANQLAC